MSFRKIDIIFLLFLLAVGVFYLIPSIKFIIQAEQFALSPGFFPIVLVSILIILCLISVIQTVISKHKEDIFQVDNLKYIIATFVLTILYISLWYFFSNLFYLLTFLFFFGLSIVYSVKTKRITRLLVLRNGMSALIITGMIYLVFGLLFSIRF